MRKLQRALKCFVTACTLLTLSVYAQEDKNLGNPESTHQVGTIPVALSVYKSPTCGCCAEWITHVEERHFSTQIHHPSSLAETKSQLGIDAKYRSCHTAVDAQGFVFEGHVPAKLISQFLANPPANALGLSVPGMPAGSPGMEMANTFTPYPVLLLMKDGSAQIYATIKDQDQQY
ncbi:DUF411 domain-containing protein [Neptunomonas phycophila]|uniref:DUF411 domain-containing protein n=1 Tax=Neptunomonas phycophila TaxID=1572645 RepID=UPI000948F0C9|nr:DUF411 domain-containing protein [Neptunomonas phycophila]